MSEWKQSVEEHRDALETVASAGGPLADDCQRLLEEYERVKQ